VTDGRTDRQTPHDGIGRVAKNMGMLHGPDFNRQFLPRDAMHKRGLCHHAVSVCLSHVRGLCQNEQTYLENFFIMDSQ